MHSTRVPSARARKPAEREVGMCVCVCVSSVRSEVGMCDLMDVWCVRVREKEGHRERSVREGGVRGRDRDPDCVRVSVPAAGACCLVLRW